MTTFSLNPTDGAVLGAVLDTEAEDLAVILAAAAEAAPAVAAASPARRGKWIRAIAHALDERSADLIDLAHQETALGHPRLTSELARTTGQLRFLAAHAETGAPFAPTIDTADPAWQPTPRPDLRSVGTGIGPVLVFAAGNFPFAFSVAGGDTASAWAAGCPVIVKAHPGHPLLSTAVGDIIGDTLVDLDAPAGMFGLVHGFDAGVAALLAPVIAAGAFTGSLSGGRALHDLASRRETPIPFFAEMGSVNPVVITERADAERAEPIADGLCGSFLLGAGQFCTKPGLILVPADSDLPKRLATLVADRPAPTLLDHRVRDRHRSGIAKHVEHPAVEVVGTGRDPDAPGAQDRVTVTSIAARDLVGDPTGLIEEHFGPSTVLVKYDSPAELRAVLDVLPGSLTGTVHRGADEDVTDLVAALAARAGRVLVDEWPTGVAVSWAQFHGGPYPATTDARFTAVGSGAVSRFLRPVAYQNVPAEALPALLRDANPDGVLRRVDGVLTTDEVRP